MSDIPIIGGPLDGKRTIQDLPRLEVLCPSQDIPPRVCSASYYRFLLHFNHEPVGYMYLHCAMEPLDGLRWMIENYGKGSQS